MSMKALQFKAPKRDFSSVYLVAMALALLQKGKAALQFYCVILVHSYIQLIPLSEEL